MSELVKHYQNTMQGIPQLTNNWGAMIALLDAVLVTGFNHVPILGLSKSSASSITATINLGSGHGFIDRQVVRIAGSTNGWDGDYKVLSADSTSITVECTAAHASTILGTATCFTAPLDFEIVHQTPVSSIEPKRAYRSTDPESLGLILLVHDFCSVGAAAAGAKFAKVGLVESMTDIDTIVGNQLPENSNNWGWDGTHHGCAKWYYATPAQANNYDTRNDTVAPSNGNRSFTIVADDISIAVLIRDSFMAGLYGIFEFFDTETQGLNVMLAAAGAAVNISQSQVVFPPVRGAIGVGAGTSAEYGGGGGVRQKGILWYSGSALREDTLLSRPLILCHPTNNIGTTQIASTVANNIYMQTPIIDSSNKFRGVMPFVRLQVGAGLNGMFVTEDGLVSAISVNNGNFGSNIFALSLELQ